MHPSFLEPRYQPTEVARLLQLHASTVRRWLGSPATGAGTVVQKASTTNWASFLDLVELYIAVELHKRRGIGLPELKRRLREAGARQHIEHPLAKRTFLLDGTKMWLPVEGHVVDLGSGGQLGFVEIVRQVAENIDFNVEGIAERWWPLGKAGSVVIDPLVAFGSPVVSHTRINTAAVFDTWEAEDHDVALVAAAFGLGTHQVEQAVAFERKRAA